MQKANLNKYAFRQARLTSVNNDKTVTITEQNGNVDTLSFDYLVICTGFSYSLPAKDTGCLNMEGRVKGIHDYHDRIDQADSVIIAGGGVVGVELAAELAVRYRG